MKNFLEDFAHIIAALPCQEQEKAALQGFAPLFEKALLRSDFQMKRTLKDKSIVVNLLNTTIEDLRVQQAIVRRANEELSRQKAEIEAQNLALQQQKQLLEEQSRRLAENLRELEQSYHELEQFSYIASHDLKSPLRTIASYAQLLQRRCAGSLDAEAGEFIRCIIKGATNMNDTIRDLLEYSQVGREKGFVKTDLNETLDMVRFNLQQEIQESRATILSQPLPVLHVHRSGVQQLFQNLVGNAIKFRGEQPPLIRIGGGRQEAGECWQFSVSDNGLGLDEAYQAKAFLPFQRVSHLDRPGTGMGLAICRKIVKMHRGEIWYHSHPPHGTTFHFTFSQEGL